MRKILLWLALLFGGLGVAVAALALFFDVNQFRPMLGTRLSDALGREVKIGKLKLALFSGAVAASDLAIADDSSFSPKPFLTARSLDLGVDLKALIFDRKLHVTRQSLTERKAY